MAGNCLEGVLTTSHAKQPVHEWRHRETCRKVIGFDLPLSNRDAKLRTQMRPEIMRLRHRPELTSIQFARDQVEATTLAYRLMVAHDGSIDQVGLYGVW